MRSPCVLQESFGIWGEFYVTPARYATMTGRGRDNTMYGRDVYLDETRPNVGDVDVFSWCPGLPRTCSH